MIRCNTITMIFLAYIGFTLWYLTIIENKVWGVDSWYWLRVSKMKPWMFNLFAFLFFIGIRKFFKNKIAYLFFILNLATLKFLEVELDDYVFLLSSFIIISQTGKLAEIIGLIITFIYIFIHRAIPLNPKMTEFVEMNMNPLFFMFLLPTYTLLYIIGRKDLLAMVLLLSALFPYPKIISSAIMIFVFSIMINLKIYESNKIRFLAIIFLIIWIIMSAQGTIRFVNEYNKAIELCNPLTKVCYNDHPDKWWLGHYLEYIGFKPLKYPW